MQGTLDIPDEMAYCFTASVNDLSCAMVEAPAMEAYRSGELTTSQTRRLLGFETRDTLDGFLKARSI